MLLCNEYNGDSILSEVCMTGRYRAQRAIDDREYNRKLERRQGFMEGMKHPRRCDWSVYRLTGKYWRLKDSIKM